MPIPINMLGFESLDFASFAFGKYAFIAVIVFLIIYLIKPKPNEKVIPSLMFLLSRKKKGKFNSFLRKIIRDPLMLIQLLLLLFLCISALEPFVSYKHDVSSENTVLVLDVSASMQVSNNFNKMQRYAKDNAKGTVSVILIKNHPTVLFKDENQNKAHELIDTLRPSYSTSNILDSLKKADELMSNKTGRIVVISDFIDTENSLEDLQQYKEYLEGKGRFVNYIVLDSADNNVGFINSELINNKLTLSVKNYNNKIEKRTIKSGKNSIDIEIQPKSIENIKMDVDKGISTISLSGKDDFNVDDKFYLNIPTNREMKILLITNNENSFLKDFLLSSPYIKLDIVKPPKIPKINHDVVIINDVKKNMFLSKISDDVKNYVYKGGALIINTQKDYNQLGVYDISPVKTNQEIISEADPIIIKNEVTKDLTFSKINNFYKTTAKENSITLVSSNNSAIVAFKTYGTGNVMYYGIPEENNDFKVSASYPLFWSRALRYVSRFNDFDSLNRKSNELGYDSEIGIRKSGNKKIAVNLLNEKESDVVKNDKIESFINDVNQGKKQSFILKDVDLIYFLIPFVIFLILFEIFFIKYRGDI